MTQRMRSLLMIGAFPAVAAAWVGLDTLRTKQDAETAAVSRPVEHHDLGPTCQGDTILFTATVRNDTAEAIRIEETFADCGCTSVVESVAGRTLLPGGCANLAATYAADTPGPFDRSIRIGLSDGRTIRHRFTGTVVPAVKLQPSSLQSEVAASQLQSRLVVEWGDALRLREAELHPPGDYQIAVSAISDEAATLTITPTAEAPHPYSGTAFIRLDSPLKTTLTLPVRIGMPAGPTLAAASD